MCKWYVGRNKLKDYKKLYMALPNYHVIVYPRTMASFIKGLTSSST